MCIKNVSGVVTYSDRTFGVYNPATRTVTYRNGTYSVNTGTNVGTPGTGGTIGIPGTGVGIGVRLSDSKFFCIDKIDLIRVRFLFMFKIFE